MDLALRWLSRWDTNNTARPYGTGRAWTRLNQYITRMPSIRDAKMRLDVTGETHVAPCDGNMGHLLEASGGIGSPASAAWKPEASLETSYRSLSQCVEPVVDQLQSVPKGGRIQSTARHHRPSADGRQASDPDAGPGPLAFARQRFASV